MRMWMVDPRLMCRQHLLGEHLECHMLLGSILRKRSVAGFLDRKIIEPQSLKRRHDELAREMIRRGYNHNSPIERQPAVSSIGGLTIVDQDESLLELRQRCRQCRTMS